MAGPCVVLVDRFSATYPRPWDLESSHAGFNRTHSDLVKFSPGDIDYLRVRSVLRDITSKAAALITTRFLIHGTKNLHRLPFNLVCMNLENQRLMFELR